MALSRLLSPFKMTGATSGTTTLLVADAVSPNITFPSATSTLATVSGALGTPTSGTLTNCTGLPATTGLVAGTANYKLFTNVGGTALEWAKGHFVGTISRTLSTASGNVAITGVGFKPTLVIFMAAGGANAHDGSWGADDGTNRYAFGFQPNTTDMNTSTAQGGMMFEQSAGYTFASIASFDSDGFTLTWTKVSSPTGGAVITFIAFR
jgi:hypothetical protein